MPTRENRLSLEMLTLFGMPPLKHIRLASELGCAGVSLGLMGRTWAQVDHGEFEPYPPWSLTDDPELRRETKAALRDTGVRVSLGEGFRVLPGEDVSSLAGKLDVMAELGAEHINGGTMDPDVARSHDQLASLADMSTARGMRLSLEFAPSNALNTLDKAIDAVNWIGPDKCDLLVDAMHFFRCGATVADLAKVAPTLLGYAQLCDVPLEATGENYLTEAMYDRKVPGEGELPLSDWIAALPSEIWIGLEVPTIADLRNGLSPQDHAARTVAAARRLLAIRDASPDRMHRL